ncbi:hypothetical protein GDO86_015628 [Hymenochirus boettgeri]|uniref:Complement factor B n=1 Tax=Hymenochirus boettgeri TaxID=247094 RepID=A0A8T2JTN7_9PIPI|nr:hypothetical protein GDO86_015628 [Hymenochirus boettgeri]
MKKIFVHMQRLFMMEFRMMLPLLLLIHISGYLAASDEECDISKVDIIGGNYTVSDGGKVDSKVEYQCPKGKYPYPAYSRQCQYTGNWTHQEYKAECKDVLCPKPGKIDGGFFYPKEDIYRVGDVLNFECDDVFEMKGSRMRTCLENAKWSGVTTICEDNNGYCPDPGTPIGADKTGISYNMESRVSYTCSHGLVMFGSKMRECLEDKSWSGTEPSCRRSYTYDAPEEVANSFSSSLLQSVDTERLEERSDRKVQIKKDGLMNIFILLDTSKSLKEEEFDILKNSSIAFIDKVSEYDITPSYCIISFASEALSIVALRDKESKEPSNVMEKMEKFSYSSHKNKQGTNTGAALKSVYEQLIEQDRWYKNRGDTTSFMKTQNVILLLTDGKYNMGGDPRVMMARIKDFLDIGKRKEDLREEYLDVYVFGVGSDIDQLEINDLASKKDNEIHVFHLKNVNTMKSSFDGMISETDVMDTCGISKYYSTDPKEIYPWIAEITIIRNGIPRYCKGTILSPYFILTAAHCFELNDDPSKIKVGINTGEHKVQWFWRHENYNPLSKKDKGLNISFDYDVALLELTKKDKIQFQQNTRPICIPCTEGTSHALKKPQATACSEHENILMSGDEVKAKFITDKREQEASGVVEAAVQIKRGQKRLECLDAAKKELKEVKNIEDAVTDQFLCTGGIEPEIELPTCKGDSGGPLLVQFKKRFIQVGIISWGIKEHCDEGKRIKKTDKNNRDFYQSIFKVWGWIKKILNERKETLKFLSQ